MEKKYFNNNRKAVLLLSDKKKSFDKTMNGDFNLKKGIIDRSKGQKKYIYIGAQILNNSVFRNKKIGTFSMNLIWNFFIKKKVLLGINANKQFLHVSNLTIYRKLIKKKF